MESFELITDVARFAEIASEWDALATKEFSPFLLSTWVLAWWRTVAEVRGMRVAVLWRDGQLVAGLPLQVGPRGWEAPVEHGTPPFYGMVAADDAARSRLAAEALAAAPSEMMLRALRADDPALESLMEAARGARRFRLAEEMPACLFTDTTGSFEDYRAGMSPKVRSELGRLKRKAAREHDLQLKVLAAPHDLEAQWLGLVELEAAGWKGESGSALARHPKMGRFFAEFARNFHTAGMLRFSELMIDERLAAVALSVIHQERCYTLKVAYDEQRRRLGPGFILLLAMIERCFELRLDAYEFSGSEEEYERRFATGKRDRRRVRVYRPNPAGGTRYVYRRRLRPLLRDIRRTASRGSAATAP